ncbi:hypothetical protein AV274_0138 [Blastocystis sp. ATCC 50177/Nand II]|uniref:Mitochondrial import inner membrane translocase subunit Tim21 n=1 Tax=Blastocystis sp. subtype 1 (strain ATCC 50177 / NandII) TaxID=478820 RepID=A0A196SM23_BLAHN|nr:hypothetical protein AV274_0138 [Blastocystis sp. ATCC 50177/Nand II]
MNPVVYQRLLRSCVFPVKNVGFLLRKSSFTRRAFSSLALGKRGSSHVRIAAERGAALFSSPAARHFATAAESSSNLSIYVTGVVASAVIGGGIYYYSLSLKKSPIFQEALSLLNRSELVREVLGSSVRSISLARGSMKKEVSTITFIIRGESGEYLVSLVAKKVDEKLVIDTLSFHKRSQVPVYEYYVIRDGEVVTELDPEKKEKEVVETMEEPELKEAFDEKKL